ncbi:hypothetical protein [Mycobacterium sp.]|uniref:hypothetical protein n=1 Tax=Mycobacterium sp. TaxID=1785 RepID=UPI003F9B4F34
MTWTRSSGVRSSITKVAVAGVLIGIPMAAVSLPAYAAPDLGGASKVLPAPLPADPPTNAPEPPPPPPAPWQSNYGYTPQDWWGYGTDASGGGGGGG